LPFPLAAEGVTQQELSLAKACVVLSQLAEIAVACGHWNQGIGDACFGMRLEAPARSQGRQSDLQYFERSGDRVAKDVVNEISIGRES
jgi:hypothetical protein